MNPLLLAAVLCAQPASQPGSRPLPGGGTGADVQGDLTIIFELDENHLKTQESWNLKNNSGKRVSAKSLVFTLPVGSRRVTVDEAVKGFAASEDGTHIAATRDLGAGDHILSGAYLLPREGGLALYERNMPINLTALRVIVENVDGVTLSANVQHESRVRELNGLEFVVYDLGPVNAGQPLSIKLDGLPSHKKWPRNVAVGLSVASVFWMIWALRSSERSSHALGALSSEARRERIVKALELLERDKEAEKVKPKRYARRQKELMEDLAQVLREIDLARS